MTLPDSIHRNEKVISPQNGNNNNNNNTRNTLLNCIVPILNDFLHKRRILTLLFNNSQKILALATFSLAHNMKHNNELMNNK